MATGAHPQSSLAPPTPPPVQPPAYDQLIESQLRKTRTQVKLVEIVSNTLLLVAGALGFMLLVAWIDHWVFALGFWTRLLALTVLVGGAGWWLAVRILPLVIRRINPVYAAYTIEQAEPSLKNSLINFLLLRKHREEVHAVVYQAVGQRAASDISHVPAENIVDYSHVLKIGYVLAALLVVGAIYKIVSPKDPFQSAARIAVPWADIDRPSRVDIEDVAPGDVSIFQGDHLEVSATIRGAGGGDDVHLLYSTIDGQVVDQQFVMQLDEAGARHVVKIPGDDYGAQSSLQYKIVAGDAQTRWHNAEVVPAPHVLVTKVEYTPPRYTDREPLTDTRGDIDGLEGTLVTVHARANREVASALLVFDPLSEGVTDEARASSNSQTVSIRQIDGRNVKVSFYLRLKSDRRTPWRKNYTIRFNTTDGYRNQKSLVHSIDVKPDLAPLAEILSPMKTEIELPLNRKLKIEARAIDPDFALSKVRLVAVSGGRDLLDVALLESAQGHEGQAIKTFEFLPARYDLAVKDRVDYWIVAQDNRMAVKSNTPEPNITRSTPTYRMTIVAPQREEGERSPDDLSAGENRDQPEDGDASSGGAPQEGNNGGDSGGENAQDNQENNTENAGGETSDAGGQGGGQSSNAAEAASESAENAGGDSGGASGSQASDSQQGESDDNQAGGASQSPAGGASGESRPSDGQSSARAGQNGAPRDEPLENDGSRDGDIFDAINEHRQQQEQQGGASNSQSGGNPGDLRDKDLSSDNQQGAGQNTQQHADKQNQDQTGGQSSGSQQNQSGQENGGAHSGGGAGEKQGNQQNQGGGDKSQQDQGGANDQQQNQDAGGGQSEGGQPQGGAKPEDQQNQSGGGGQQPMGGGMGQNDQAGAGQQTDGGGSPQSQAEDEQQGNKPKSGGGQQAGQKQEQGGKSPGGSRKDSNSQGSGGDRKGGGEQGGGQSSQQQGQDSAGASSSGEQGDGAANEPGAGQSGNQAGGDQIANSPTGRSGEQAGEGSSTGNVDGGERNDDQPPPQGDHSSGDPSSSGSRSGGGSPQDASANPQDPSGERVSESSGDGRGTPPTGGGKPADNHPSDTPLPDHEPGSDKANLEYARQATDLTLDYLKNQKNKPDPELLDKLGWTKDDLANFVQRWERMKGSAAGASEASEEARRLDDSLRSLGLRPPRDKFRTGPVGNDRLTGQRDTANRTRPPKEYEAQYRAFSKFVQPAAE